MVKFALSSALAGLCALWAGSATADPFWPGFYTVIGYSGLKPNYKSVANVSPPSYLDGVEADAGWRFNRYYSVEAGYNYDVASTHDKGNDFNATVQSGAIDGIGYLPFGGNSPLALFGDVGAAVFFVNNQSPLITHGNHTRFGGRAGGGLQYQFDDDLGVRLSGRYEWSGDSYMRSAEVFTVGLVWQR